MTQTKNEAATTAPAAGTEKRKAGAFDIRTFIGLLLGLYGAVLTVAGAIGPSAAELAKSGGVNVNLWTGIALLVAAALLTVWAKVRPVIVEEEPAGTE